MSDTTLGAIIGFSGPALLWLFKYMFERHAKKSDLETKEIRDLREEIGVRKRNEVTVWKKLDEHSEAVSVLIKEIRELEKEVIKLQASVK